MAAIVVGTLGASAVAPACTSSDNESSALDASTDAGITSAPLSDAADSAEAPPR